MVEKATACTLAAQSEGVAARERRDRRRRRRFRDDDEPARVHHNHPLELVDSRAVLARDYSTRLAHNQR